MIRDHGNLVFISARPHLYKDVSEKVSYAKFHHLQERRGMHTSPTLLPGSFEAGYQFVMEGAIEPLAQKKAQSFEQYASLYPEYSFVFIGDNGQGDLRTAEIVLTRQQQQQQQAGGSGRPVAGPGGVVRVDAVYIHRVQPLPRTYGYDHHACK